MRVEKHILMFICLLLLGIELLTAAPPQFESQINPIRGGRPRGISVENGDTTYLVTITPIYIFARPRDMRKYQQLIRRVKKVYPYAKDAAHYLQTLEVELMLLKTEKERDAFTEKMENEIVKKYTPVLKKMTFSEGKILLRLIDRETKHTSYELLRTFRGRFAAGFWNIIARMFSANLKSHYDPSSGEDELIEYIIMQIETGLL